MEDNENQETTFESKCAILSELWLNYRDDPDYTEFMEYNDLGLPMAYIIDSSIMEPTTIATAMIEETFAMFLQALEVEEDTGFESLDEIIGD